MSSPTATSNAATVARIYKAFGRGDLPAILEVLPEDVAWDPWQDNFAQRAGVPHLQLRRGPAEVTKFFGVVGDYTVHDFHVLDLRFVAGDEHAVGLHTERAERDGPAATMRLALIAHLRDGQIVEIWEGHTDPHEFEDFWTAKHPDP